MRQQYKRLASQIHPDKCAISGAEAAFKYLGRAVAFCSAATPSNGNQVAADYQDSNHPWWDAWDEPEQGPDRGKDVDGDEQCDLEELEAMTLEV